MVYVAKLASYQNLYKLSSFHNVIQDPVWKHRKDRHDNSNPEFDYESWKQKHTAFADEAVPRWIKAVKEEYGQPETKYACVG